MVPNQQLGKYEYPEFCNHKEMSCAYHLWVWKKTPSSDENADLADILILAWWDSEHGIQSHHARYLTYKKCEITIFCCFKPLHLWYSVMQDWKIIQLKRKHCTPWIWKIFFMLTLFIPDIFSSVSRSVMSDSLETLWRYTIDVLAPYWFFSGKASDTRFNINWSYLACKDFVAKKKI